MFVHLNFVVAKDMKGSKHVRMFVRGRTVLSLNYT